MTVKDITDVMEAFAPLGIQEEWDNSGLVIGSPEDEVHKVLLGFDCTPELIDEAAEWGADMVITHHPLIFHAMKRINGETLTGRAVMKAVRSGIAVYAAHTTADKVIAGVSGAMASRLGLVNVRILDEDGEGTGLGTVGDMPVPVSPEEAVRLVKEKFSLKTVRCSKFPDVPVSRVAMCGGSGASLIPAARKSGAQLFLSGDIAYHNFFTDNDFMIMDIGHFESEVDIVQILFSLIRKNFPNFAIRISPALMKSNPVYYM
ncbi:MAG: Nif3-like dinuclear metal center hexameric protein [Candidatus Cryptobacteroides sp.]